MSRDAKKVYYFCDESSYVAGEFMAVAGLAVPDYELGPISSDLVALKKRLGAEHEVKWGTAKPRKDDIHGCFADYFAEAVKAGRIHFHIRFAPFGEYDHKASGPRKRADTVSKMHYQLLLHRAVRFYGPNYRIAIRPDDGDCTAALRGQVGNLHYFGASKYSAKPDCIESLECRNSKKEIMLQLLDVPLGALTAKRNNRQVSEVKTALIERVLGHFPNKRLEGNCPSSVMDFSIWNAIPQGPAKRGPWG